ncbi:interferon-induced GTP-binding protein Mx2-like [Haliotis rubra]|uniref:interferon-induced GTP-binding protein Mx2-like n=1 Tax=Haliotis rubra TaxID=36100 RepID=UPI001EE6175E|nr:interferon-induced GTP-binding protein Mx2-like [Haliotis rubra]
MLQQQLPELKERVRNKLFETEQELHDLGEDPPKTSSEKRQLAHRMVHEFITITNAVMTGECVDDRRFPPEINNLYSDARETFEKFYSNCVAKQPNIKDHKLKSELQQKIRASRGREFCNFMGKFELVESSAREYISKLAIPALQCFDDVHKTTTDVVIILAEMCFGKFPDFAEKVKDVIMTTRKKTQNECASEIKGYISMENLVYSQDETYRSQLRTEEKKKLKETAEEGECITLSRAFLQRPVTDEDVNGVNKALMSLKSYCQVAARRLCDVIPMIIQMQVFQKKVKSMQDLLIGLVSEEENTDLIHEEEDMAYKRRETKSRYDRLLKAERELEKI